MIAHIRRRDLRLPIHAANLSLNVVLCSFFEKTIMHTLVVHDRFRAHVPSSLLRTQIRPSTSLDFQKRGGAARCPFARSWQARYSDTGLLHHRFPYPGSDRRRNHLQAAASYSVVHGEGAAYAKVRRRVVEWLIERTTVDDGRRTRRPPRCPVVEVIGRSAVCLRIHGTQAALADGGLLPVRGLASCCATNEPGWVQARAQLRARLQARRTWGWVQSMLGRRIQYHVTRRWVKHRDDDLVGGDVRLVHALVEKLLPAAAVVIDSPVALVAACRPNARGALNARAILYLLDISRRVTAT